MLWSKALVLNGTDCIIDGTGLAKIFHNDIFFPIRYLMEGNLTSFCLKSRVEF